MQFHPQIPTQIHIGIFEYGDQTSMTRFDDFSAPNPMELSISPATATLQNPATGTTIPPTDYWGQQPPIALASSISLTLQSLENRQVIIHDSAGNPLTQTGSNISRQLPNGGREHIGQAIAHNNGSLQLILSLDQYTLTNLTFDSTATPEIIIAVVENNRYTSHIRYYNFAITHPVELIVSPAVVQLANTATNTIIQPTEIASPAQLRQMNSDRGN